MQASDVIAARGSLSIADASRIAGVTRERWAQWERGDRPVTAEEEPVIRTVRRRETLEARIDRLELLYYHDNSVIMLDEFTIAKAQRAREELLEGVADRFGIASDGGE